MAIPIPVPKPSTGINWGQLAVDVAPSIVSSGLSYLGSELTQNDNDSATRGYQEGTTAAAERLGQGYREQLQNVEAGADTLTDITRSQYADTTNVLQGANQDFARGTRDAYGAYGDFIYPQVNQYGDQMLVADDLYSRGLEQGEQQTGDILTQGNQAYGETYQPYMESGDDARQYLQALMQTDPSQLDPYQNRLVEDYRRNAIARLASSGLRGAGRAGVAAVNEGEAALLADLYRQNQARSDNAASVLNQQGYGATGNVASAGLNTARTLGDLRYKTAGSTAGNTAQTAQQIAGTALNTGQDLGNKLYSGETKIADANRQLGKDKANLTGQFYSNLGGIESGRYTARGDTAMGIATSDATAQGRNTQAGFSNDITNSGIRGQTIGRIGNTISNSVKEGINKQRQQNQSGPGTTQLI